MLIHRKPSSEKQIAASQANGRKSRGPMTPEGKRRSSRNSIKHGLLAAATSLEAAAPDFVRLKDSLQDRHRPESEAERRLIEAKALADWRLARLIASEFAAAEAVAPSSEKNARQKRADTDAWLTLMLRYGTVLDTRSSEASRRVEAHWKRMRAIEYAQNEPLISLQIKQNACESPRENRECA